MHTIIDITKRTLGALAIAAFFVLAGSIDTAGAFTLRLEGSDFLIPRPEAQAPVGEERLIGTLDTVGVTGQVCQPQITASNGESVHQANYGLLVAYQDGVEIDRITILETESEPNVERVRLPDRTIVLGDELRLFNIVGGYTPGDNLREGFVGTSVDYVVVCEELTVTTTTTVPDSTTTTENDETTTTTVPATTTVPEGSTTTVPDSTTTTGPGSSTSTSIGTTTSTVPPVTTNSTLPFTGAPIETAGVAMAAAALLLLGGGVLLAARQEGR